MIGKIKVISETIEGLSAAGKEWKKVSFVISNMEGYEGTEQIFAFNIFGTEKVDKFLQYNKVGKTVDVDFNIKTSEWKGKYYTELQAWMIKSVDLEAEPVQETATEEVDAEELPF